MRRLATVACALLAVLVASGVAVGGASAAAPEFGRCVKQLEGGYKDGGCTKAAKAGEKSSYVWQPGAVGATFSDEVESGFTAKFETVPINKVAATMTCATMKVTGTVTSAKTVEARFLLGGCKSKEFWCHNTEAPETEGQVESLELTGLLGWEKEEAEITKSKLALGLKGTFENVAGTKEVIAEFTCGENPNVMRGSVLRHIIGDRMLLSETAKYVEAKGVQKPTHFEARTPEEQEYGVLQVAGGNGKFFQTGLTTTLLQTNPVSFEASAVN